jgi:hypothetical protein
MFCSACGQPALAEAAFCNRCGNRLVPPESRPFLGASGRGQESEQTLSPEERVRYLAGTSPKRTRCDRCGSNTHLSRHRFGFAKILSKKTDWGGTIGVLAASAISVAIAPVTGGAVIGWKRPGKSTSYSVVKAEIILCFRCANEAEDARGNLRLREADYRCHPWADLARSAGYDTFLSTADLASMASLPEKR